MDMLQLEFAAESFDVVLDKCSMDALLVDEGDPWFPRAECVAAVARYLDGVARVLAPGGKFLQVSFGQPHFRRGYLTRAGLPWALEVKTFGEFFHYFFYKMQRRADAAPPKPEPEPEAAAPPPAALAQQQQQQQQPAQQLPSALVPPPDTP
jgi:SAM-dependent methyltransferase